MKRFFLFAFLMLWADFAAAEITFDGTTMSGAGTYASAINVSGATGQTVTITPTGGNINLTGAVNGSGTIKNTPVPGCKLQVRGDWSGFSGTLDSSGAAWVEAFSTSFANTAWKVAGTNAIAFCATADSTDPASYYVGAIYGGTANTEIRSSGGSSKSPVKVVVGNASKALVADSQNVFAGKIVDANVKGLGLEKIGPGTWTLSGTNTYSLGTSVSGGTLRVSGSIMETALTINAGGTLELYGAGSLTADKTDGNASISNDGTFRITKDSSYNLNRAVTGTGNLIKDGTGTLTCSVESNYSGFTEVLGGKLSATTATLTGSTDYRIADGATMEINYVAAETTFAGKLAGEGTFSKIGGGKLILKGSDLSAFNGTFTASGTRYVELYDSGAASAVWNIGGGIDAGETGSQGLAFCSNSGTDHFRFGALTGTGWVIIGSKSLPDQAVTLTVGNESGALLPDSENVFSGILNERLAANPAILSVEKVGPGTWTLAGANTYTGETTVKGGTLKIANTGSVNSDVTIEAGSGADAPALILDGTINGDLTVNGLFTFDFTDSLTPEGTVTGNVTLGEDALLKVLLNGAPSPEMAYTLNAGSVDPGSRSFAEIYEASVAAGLMSDVWAFSSNGGALIMSIDGAKVPEPASWLILVLGLGLAAGCRRTLRRS